ncbi:HDOD domain-containing protein [methanotrophic endosymbiont of Bathymodiolus puteoserpentis (Logatchev)]|jgi:HD-like signal output (HDOD) protein|uniref:HDOD domain-containing protein n=1 Tax=methanotrophic endosymbiont of Bathymodiolus puteoserpentis (Logatchev) TaxID=343235 RepID=UPI0013C96FE1|nr:HDOD domain-containing protein [methanotrophic endosymbiont of Bathymodiolus puteoserpentis (Logatchev)]SHE20198.1 Predicted signal transduction protein [methanotrophic endosymbiont of Bathymodiolus puteoserpentis (Logatchev)]
MALIPDFFKSKKTNGIKKGVGMEVAETISVDDLKKLIPIRQLKPEFLETFALEHKAKIFPKGATLFAAGMPANNVYFLLQGEVKLTDQNGVSYTIDNASPKSRFALFAGTVHTTTAIAKTDVSILAVSQKIMQMHQTDKQVQQLELPPKYTNNRLLQLFVQNFSNDEVQIPAMPDTALHLRKSMQQEIGVHEAVKIIQLDPVISGKLIQVANCPLYITQQPAKSCLEAVNRIGLIGTRSLVTTLCLKQIFNSKKPVLKKYMDALWKRSIYISSISHVLAKETGKVDPEEALLAGLVVDIGIIPLLSFTDNLPDGFYTEAELKEAMGFVRGVVGRRVLERWDFPEELADIPLYSNDWYQNRSKDLSVLDVVVLAQLHSKIGQKDNQAYPAISSIPAASKLNDATLSPEHSLAILHDAKDKINNALRAFSH